MWIRDARFAFAPARVVMRDDAGNCTCIGDDGKVTMPTGAPRKGTKREVLASDRSSWSSKPKPSRSIALRFCIRYQILEPRSACAVASLGLER